jgi:hypothetical protein
MNRPQALIWVVQPPFKFLVAAGPGDVDVLDHPRPARGVDSDGYGRSFDQRQFPRELQGTVFVNSLDL